ncbi:MAG: hypothetical protein LBR54_04620 [Oscillospiraceae bacterium]|nr:hypothetical protein [Oscillospiraceae bacterium]
MQKISEILLKQEQLLLEYETLTQKMCDCAEDETEGMLEKREEIIERLDAINVEIREEIANLKNPERIRSVLNNKPDFDELSEHERAISEQVQNIASVMSRIDRINTEVISVIRRRQDDILTQIKNVNTGTESVAAKYRGNIGDVSNMTDYHIPEQFKKI